MNNAQAELDAINEATPGWVQLPAIQAIIADDQVCRWTYDAVEDRWSGECDVDWHIPHESTPEENEMNYCPKCGRKLVIEPTEDEKS